ncbi:DNA methyltransferase [Pseudobutyrivibrio ruminis]|uniref:DNA methyltransferase n=1 Tax=Pseudobutyrivibrio ruminis TaxID=46206 RepID=UPI0004295651|nr:DNA methyltransferase [Pseudobutyrivibrio ruminis]
MEKRKLTKEDLDKLRDIEGFPIAEDEDIIALSDAPNYTACPNPFIEDFLAENGTEYDETMDDYHREPFASDVAEGKSDQIYNIHSYHTKVPPRAIKAYIEHYTKPGDIVLDSFCGTGMTGVAAKICDDNGVGLSARHAILTDISTIAAFIAGNYNQSIREKQISDIENVLKNLKEKCHELYKTKHLIDDREVLGLNGEPIYGEINYMVWSDVFICPHCSSEFVYYKEAVEKETRKSLKEFPCPKCGLILTKAKCLRAVEAIEDPISGLPMNITKSVPVRISYSVNGTRYTKEPDQEDIARAHSIHVDYRRLPNAQIKFFEGDKTPEMFRGNLKYVWQAYRSRTLNVIQSFLDLTSDSKALFLLTSTLPKLSILNRFMPEYDDKEHKYRALVGPMAGTFYLPPLSVENNVVAQLEFQFNKLKRLSYKDADTLVSTQSATCLSQIPDNCVDYVFVDPPFGANIMYSELNILSESWLGVLTNNAEEAIMNNTQNKSLVDYQGLMIKAFCELYRVLKPNRWITIEFHNSKNSVWNAIQEAINRAGFVIADVRILNKEKKTINQLNAKGTVDQDLVISAYKPKESLKKQLMLDAGTEESAWDFVRQHLEKLPVTVTKNGRIELISERQDYLLFDRMVAYHIMQGIPVPIDATDFYHGLDERFLKRDGMYFLPDQVNEYDTARIKMDVEPVQLSFVVTNEKTAIGWLYQQLDVPQTYADIQPRFMKEVKTVDKYELIPELSVILEENFLQDETGKWYIPDVTKEGDVIKLREKKLIKEFESYTQTKGKLKLFRSEAIRAGFSMLWKDKNYQAIVDMAQRLPDTTIQEDQNLLMYYDISLSRI